MPDWHERITDDTRPSIRAEHALRYAVAAPLIRASARWCDLGCGSGLAAADALGDAAYEGRALLVDRAAETAERAAAAVPARDAVALAADLADADGVAAVRAALADGDGPLCVTCLETIHQLADFAPLVALLSELAAEPGCSVVLSVPNDAYWSLEREHAATSWGEGAVEELRSLLPADQRVLHQVALAGSALLPAGERAEGSASFALAPGIPSHVVVAFGAGVEQLCAPAPAAAVAQADVEAQRRWERQRESDLLHSAAAIAALERRLAACETAPAAAPAEVSDAPAAGGQA